MNQNLRNILGFLIIISLFGLCSYIVKTNQEFISNSIGNGFSGIFLYLIITIVAVVIAPISMTPLIPLAANAWGVLTGSLINILGWSLGSFIVFLISRRYGVPIVKKFVSLKKLSDVEGKISSKNVFISLIVLRMITPVDILSYAVSLFTKINFRTYAITTVIGIAPFAFVLSYLGTIPFYYQIIGFIVMGLLIGIIVGVYQSKKR